jgi:prevent-host-death family protein
MRQVLTISRELVAYGQIDQSKLCPLKRMSQMPKHTAITAIPAYIARTQLGSLLKQVVQRKARFLITKSGKPTAVLLSASDFDDILEELDPEFQQSLTAAAKEYRAGRAVSLRDYLKSRLSARRAG